MRLRKTRSTGGFTLVELLVVITIISILFALTAAAVVRAIAKGDEVRERNEISQLANGVQAFKQGTSAPYLPDTFSVQNVYNATDANFKFLRSVWPRIGTKVSVDPAPAQFQVLWQTGPATTNVLANTTISGSQCLVLFLAGVDGVSGYSNDPTQPFKYTTAPVVRLPLYYEFDQSRLSPSPTTPQTTVPHFIDLYGTEYAYFTSYKAGSDYTTTARTTAGVSMLPYKFSNGRFANPSTFQIISAGKDQTFGAGNFGWAAGGGSDVNGADDVSNFHPTFLGIAAN